MEQLLQSLPLILLFLICPVIMMGMMFFMPGMHGHKKKTKNKEEGKEEDIVNLSVNDDDLT